MLKILSEKIGFEYDLFEVEDKKFGALSHTLNQNGRSMVTAGLVAESCVSGSLGRSAGAGENTHTHTPKEDLGSFT